MKINSLEKSETDRETIQQSIQITPVQPPPEEEVSVTEPKKYVEATIAPSITIISTPVPSKVITKVPVNINSVIYYCIDSNANQVSAKHAETERLKKESVACDINNSWEVSKCQQFCISYTSCTYNCGGVIGLDAATKCLDSCVPCDCPNPYNCQDTKNAFNSAKIELEKMIKDFCN